MLLYMIRHGETDYNIQRKMQGWTDIPLNEKGIELAVETGRALRDVHFDRVITSPLRRAVDTARLVLEGRDIPYITDRRIMELGNGEWEGLTMEEIEARGVQEEFKKMWADPMHYKGAPGGESIQQLLVRTGEFLDDLFQNAEYQEETILVATHGAAMRALLHRFYEDPNDFWHGCVPPNCSINIVKEEDGNVVLLKEDVLYYDQSLIGQAHPNHPKNN